MSLAAEMSSSAIRPWRRSKPQPAGALVAEPEDALAIGDHDRVDLAPGPVGQDLRPPVLVRIGQEQATAAPVDVTELMAGQPHRRCVDDREHLLHVVGDEPVKEHFVGVLQRAQVDMPGEIVAITAERLAGTQRLLAECLDRRRQ